ncbi:carbohydrate ABC transporter membrane protein 1 (CUT1 family) [Isoptericola jiangsuensis]|uniref:Carbohydrate ABC transporter membrane protein 1 (CUT1 family) n=1 Tax=Isoptericola jiangsuensis TaxID=548579 RepID=A0A2A9F007_9MICO|nr:carbohydrate ABC transporter membrane protein 1 (CUT1 family) [Isoptericola jiangsuensis]
MSWLLEPSGVGEKFLVMFVAILLFVAVMSLILFVVDRPKRIPNWVVALGFVGLPLAFLLYGLVRPALITLWNSFFNRNSTEFVGVDNYVTAFTQPQFQKVLLVTAAWVILAPLLSTVIGLVYAVLVDRTRFEKLAKALVFIPMAISMVGASIIWGFVYEFRPDQAGIQQIGLLNQLLVWLGFPPQQFLIGQPWNTGFLIVVMIWIQTGFAMTVLSAAIKAIPDDIVEAARLDGLHGMQMFRFITVPSIRPALVVVLTTIAMATLKAFDIVRTMTGGQFGTQVVANEFYTQAFRQNNQGLAAALAVVLFILVIPIIVYNVGQMRKAEDIR